MYPVDENDPTAEHPTVLPKTRKKVAGEALTQNVQAGSSFLPMAQARLSKIDEELNRLDSEPVDMSSLQAYARRQGETGNASMLNALAAQFAGESFQPVQAQFLKRAAAAQEPIKVAGGVLSPDGQFIKDPTVARDVRRSALERQQAGVMSMMEKYEQAAAESRRRAEDAEANRALRREIAASRPADNSKQWRAEDTLRGDFDKSTKTLMEELAATSKITDIVKATPPGQKPDAITQQSLVILLNKFLDPGSVVREGEFDRVVKAQGLIGQAQNLSDRILRGQPLDANTIRQIDGLAKMYQSAAESKIRKQANDYSEIARRRGLNVESVISDPRYRGGNVVDFNSLPK